ncbi:hypothetical protein M9H77_19923 [Catharanthus roseus]|uniref:Uncharacterized protein n=1 Tax=Catharanthus roseus TaxID=4058 RepID=A0ACC0AJM7_CATRO|nr:hypothetical protein M9H77_19923 [Catharanthus roseus]
MIELLFSVIFGQMALILLLLFKTPLRKLLIMALDRVKRGRGPLVLQSVAATVFVIMVYTIYGIREMYSHPAETSNPTDQVFLAYQTLQASLMGFSLFLAMIIDRLHQYIRELRSLRNAMEAAKKQNRGFDDAKNGGGEELNALKVELSTYREKVNTLESELNAKLQELKAAEGNAESLKKQSEGLLLEYDRLLEENQNLRSQLQSIDQSASHSDDKKNS